MTTKLTLTMQDGVIESAKEYARKNGKSLSGIVENYLKSITTLEKPVETLSPKVARLMGVITLPGFSIQRLTIRLRSIFKQFPIITFITSCGNHYQAMLL